MLVKHLDLLLFFMICHVCYCQRRLRGGLEPTADKPYMVYLIRAPLSDKDYDEWLCGGAIVSDQFILTSAACIEDVKYLYAIAGYHRYISDENIDEDKCTSVMKKKIVFTCVPVSYNFSYPLIEQWSQIDIALAKVETSYNFGDETYLDLCSYIPSIIPVNYDSESEIEDTDCIVMGWGHEKTWRKETDHNNYNTKTLQYISTKIISKEECLEEYTTYPELRPAIQNYMICTNGSGAIDDAGNPIMKHVGELLDGCLPGDDDGGTSQKNEPANLKAEVKFHQYKKCIKKKDWLKYANNLNQRRAAPKANRTYYNYTRHNYITKAVRYRRSERLLGYGICQNDHGGPLVTWVGSKEVVIGIASVFGINEQNECIGPSLHTSTERNADFLRCVLEETSDARRRAFCDSPPSVKGFDTIEKHISWKDHPAGPAANEMAEENFRSFQNNVKPPDYVKNYFKH